MGRSEKGSFLSQVRRFGFVNTVIARVKTETKRQKAEFIKEKRQQDDLLIDGYVKDRTPRRILKPKTV